MGCVCKVENSLSETFDFEWRCALFDVPERSVDITSQDFYSTLDGGFTFQILISKDIRYVNARSRSICVGLRKINKSVIKALFLFEILNDAGQLYLKESIEGLFSIILCKTHLSDSFDHPVLSVSVRGGKGNIVHFPGGEIIIKGKIFFQSCQEKKSSEPFCKNISQLQNDFKDLLQNKIYADVKFQIGDAVLHAHKNILSSRSAVFKKMLEQNMKEKEDNIVKITDIDKSVFEIFLIFLYTGSIQDKQLDTIMPLYSVADKYAVETLFKTCGDMLLNYICDATVVPILKLADMHNDGTLKATAIDFICKNFSKVEATESWDTLLDSDTRLASYALKQVSINAAKNNAILTEKAKKAQEFYPHDFCLE